MFKKLKERNLHLIVIALLVGLFLGINVSFLISAEEPSYKYLDYFHKIYRIVKAEYVDVPDTKSLFYGSIDGMLKSLNDPFTRFLDEKAYEELKEATTGKFVGIGIEVTSNDDEIVVVTPIDDSPAMKAGIHAGDVIVKVNDTIVKSMKTNEVVNLIKGNPKSTVTLQIKREGYDSPIDFKMERASIKIKTMEYGIIAPNNVGYIRIINFALDTSSEVAKALASFNDKKIDKVIIDLRFNPGGLLHSAIEISEMFLEKGATIVSTNGREGINPEKVFKSEKDPIAKEKLVVLINKGSASASEIFAGAMRDNKRGVLVGEKTFGKGSVQKSIEIDKNIGLAVTIARYFTPSGESIHKAGIKPDVEVLPYKFSNEEMKDINRINNENILNEFMKKDMVYNETIKKEFAEFLKSKNIKLSDKSANLLLSTGLNHIRKKPLYDVEFDDQLAKALEVIK
jgi:carboxyl-terminal processing protease